MKILVVEDSKAIRSFINGELSKAGYEVLLAETGKQAIDHFVNNDIDLVTLDIELPDMTGFQVFQEIHKHEQSLTGLSLKPVPILFITSKDDPNERAKGYALGAQDYILKSKLESELTITVDRILKADKRLKGARILCVDDSKTSRLFLRESLNSLELHFEECEDSIAAFEMLKTRASQFDLILVDYEMPKLNGAELTRKIRTEIGEKEVPIIFLTGNQKREDVVHYYNSGASDYLIKPYLKEELVNKILAQVDSYRVKRQLSSTMKSLAESKKYQEQILAACSHDLRSPLNSILGFSELLEMDLAESPEKLDFLNKIQSSSKLMLDIVGNILETARMQTVDEKLALTPVNISEFFKGLEGHNLQAAKAKDITFKINDKNIENISIMSNTSALTRVLNNLISNALKFTKKGGEVNLTVEKLDDKLVISVQDNGIGIPKDKISKLFDRFSEAGRAGTHGEKSHGLGMSIVQGMVQKMNGIISVESVENVGTTFKVQFPLPFDPSSITCEIVDSSPLAGRILHKQLKALNIPVRNHATFSHLIDSGVKAHSFVIARIPDDLERLGSNIHIFKATLKHRKITIPIFGVSSELQKGSAELVKNGSLNAVLRPGFALKDIESNLKLFNTLNVQNKEKVAA